MAEIESAIESNRSPVKMQFYSIENPVWFQLTERHKAYLVEQITTGGWQANGERRQGFLNCEISQDIVYGYYAQEGLLKIEQYDEMQQRVPEESTSFERILIVFFLDAGILAIQNRRISGYVDLSGPNIRESAFKTLETLFREAGMVFDGRAKFEPYKQTYSKEELIEIFESKVVLKIQVNDLKNQSVPQDLKLFNPNFDADTFLKGVIDTDLGVTEQIEWSGQDVQRSKIARGLMHAGNPKLVEALDDYGEPREWQRTMPESITLELDTGLTHFPADDFDRLVNHINRKMGSFRERLELLLHRRESESGDLPLFGEVSE